MTAFNGKKFALVAPSSPISPIDLQSAKNFLKKFFTYNQKNA